jgi:hypothetical protein
MVYFEFDPIAILVALLIFAVSYLIGVKKQTHLLAGFNEARVRDKEKLARITGWGHFNIGLFVCLNGCIHYPLESIVFPTVILLAIASMIIYVNKQLVE